MLSPLESRRSDEKNNLPLTEQVGSVQAHPKLPVYIRGFQSTIGNQRTIQLLRSNSKKMNAIKVRSEAGRAGKTTHRLQRSFDTASNSTLETLLLQLITNHATDQPKRGNIANDTNFRVTLQALSAPAHQGQSAWTIAQLFDASDQLIKTINTVVAVSGTDLQNVKRIEILVNFYNQETSLMNSATMSHQDDGGYHAAAFHEYERHVAPFYDLFADIQAKQNDPQQSMTNLAADVSSGTGTYAPNTQHMNPDLAFNTLRATLSYAETINYQLQRNLLMRVYLDTVDRGINLANLEYLYRIAPVNLALWQDFLSFCRKMRGAARMVPITDIENGNEIIIGDGQYKGYEGTVSHVGRDLITVNLTNHASPIQIVPSQCYFPD